MEPPSEEVWIRTRLNQHLSFYLEAAKFNPCTPGPTSCSKPPLCPHPAPAFPPLWPRGLYNSPLASLVPAAGNTIATAPTQALLYWLLVYLPKVSLGVVRARSTTLPNSRCPWRDLATSQLPYLPHCPLGPSTSPPHPPGLTLPIPT